MPNPPAFAPLKAPHPVTVELHIEGALYGGWQAISIRRSLDVFADTFDLTLTDTEAGQARSIKLGSPCQVRIDGETLITGYVDRIRPSYDAERRGITVSGRSKTADLVDCSIPAVTHKQSQRTNQKLVDIANKLAGHFGISASSEVETEPFPVSAISEGETVFEYLEKMARQQGVRLVSGADGNLVITRASDERVGTALVLGENIEEAYGEFSERDRFSHYYVTGQHAGNSAWYNEAAAHVSGEASDITARYRPTVFVEDNLVPAEAKRRAEWQRNVHYGRSRQATYTVTGWRHKDGLWRPNTRVRVIDEWMGFDDEWLMIGTVEFVLDGKGQRTRLTVMPAEAYDLVALPAEDGGVW